MLTAIVKTPHCRLLPMPSELNVNVPQPEDAVTVTLLSQLSYDKPMLDTNVSQTPSHIIPSQLMRSCKNILSPIVATQMVVSKTILLLVGQHSFTILMAFEYVAGT